MINSLHNHCWVCWRKNFWKSVNIWWNYGQECWVSRFFSLTRGVSTFRFSRTRLLYRTVWVGIRPRQSRTPSCLQMQSDAHDGDTCMLRAAAAAAAHFIAAIIWWWFRWTQATRALRQEITKARRARRAWYGRNLINRRLGRLSMLTDAPARLILQKYPAAFISPPNNRFTPDLNESDFLQSCADRLD